MSHYEISRMHPSDVIGALGAMNDEPLLDFVMAAFQVIGDLQHQLEKANKRLDSLERKTGEMVPGVIRSSEPTGEKK